MIYNGTNGAFIKNNNIKHSSHKITKPYVGGNILIPSISELKGKSHTQAYKDTELMKWDSKRNIFIYK